MTADALVPYVMKSSAVMLLNIGYKCKLVLHEEGFILPRCLKMTLNICFHNSSNNSARNGLTSIWSTSTVINKQDPNNYWPTLTTIYHAKSQAMGCAIGVFARAYLWNSGHRSLVQSRLLWFLDISYACAAPTYAPMYTDESPATDESLPWSAEIRSTPYHLRKQVGNRTGRRTKLVTEIQVWLNGYYLVASNTMRKLWTDRMYSAHLYQVKLLGIYLSGTLFCGDKILSR